MLDTKESWDALIRHHAPDERTRDEILANPLYQNISGRFVQSHDYIAMERLYEIHSEATTTSSWWTPRRPGTPSTSSTPPSAWPTSSRPGSSVG